MDRLHRELLGPSGLTAQTSVFRRRDVVRLLCDRLPAGAPGAIIEELVEQILAAPETVPLFFSDPNTSEKRFDERNVFTTRDLLALEEQVVRIAVDGQAADRGLVGVPTLIRAVGNPSGLSQEQRDMVGRLCRSGNLIDVVTGVPGAGKTRGLAAAHAAWRAAGFPVIGCSIKASAAAELQAGAGIRSWTVARLLLELERADSREGQGNALHRDTVLVVDEAAMLRTRDLARLLTHVYTARGKLVLVGDPKQLPSIDAGGLFPLLVEHLDAITLTSNRRQIDPADRMALSAFRNDEIDVALDSYRSRGRLHAYPDAGAQRAAMVTAWWTDRESGIESVMLAYRRSDIRELNQLARIRMSVAGILTGPECAVSVGNQHTTGFRAGDKVLLRRNHYPLQIHNGDRGVVAHVDPEAGTVTVQIDRTNATVTLPRRYLDTGGLDHGYAVTIHASQGITVSRSHILGNDALFFEAGLVALSRHRDACHLHVTEGIDVDERTDLERTHSQRKAKDDESTMSRRLSISRADDAAISYTR